MSRYVNWRPKILPFAVFLLGLFLVFFPSPIAFIGSLLVAGFYMLLYFGLLAKDTLSDPPNYPQLHGITRIHVAVPYKGFAGVEVKDPDKIAKLVAATNVKRATMPWKPFMGIRNQANCTIKLTYYSVNMEVGHLYLRKGSYSTYDWTERSIGASVLELTHFSSLLPLKDLPSHCVSFPN